MKSNKKERRLRQEFRLIGHDPGTIADLFEVTRETVNNWIRKDVFIPPVAAVMLQEIGISKKAIINPDEFV